MYNALLCANLSWITEFKLIPMHLNEMLETGLFSERDVK